MTPDKIAFLIFIVFVVLCISHYFALKIGWTMGIKGDFNKVMSSDQPKTKQTGSAYTDPFKAHRL